MPLDKLTTPIVETISHPPRNRLILFENQIQTTSALPCRTQVQPAASFLVCSLIFIEYEPILSQKIRESYVGFQKNAFKSGK